jgi:hypothetical protein
MRQFTVATINNQLNAALRSRFDVIQTFQEPNSQKGRKKIEKASTSQESEVMQAANMAFQFGHTAYAKFFAVHSLGAFDFDMRNFEVFCSLYTELLVKRGHAAMMARDIDKLRNLSLGVCVDRVTAWWERSEKFASVIDNADAFTRYYQLEGPCVKMKDVLIAANMAQPTNAATVMDNLILQVIKKMIIMGNATYGMEAKTDDSGGYFCTTLVKRDAEKELTDVAHSMGRDCSEAMMGRAFANLTESSVMSNKCVFFATTPNSQDNKEVLHIRKEMVTTTRVLTDTEIVILEWLRDVVGTPNHAFTLSCPDYASETDHLIHSHLVRGLLGTPPITNTPCDDHIKNLHDKLDATQRQTAMFWLNTMQTATGERLLETREDVVNPFFKILAVVDAPTNSSEPCNADGPNAGKHKEKLCMSGAMRINAIGLRAYDSDQDKQVTDAQFHFADVVMAISGEADPGAIIFYAMSDVIDETTPAAVCHTVRAWDGSVTIPNPRRREMSTVLDHAQLMDDDAILAESHMTITLDRHSNTTQKIRDACSKKYTTLPHSTAFARFEAQFSDDLEFPASPMSTASSTSA